MLIRRCWPKLFILAISEKIKEKRLKFSQESVTVLRKMEDYEEARVKKSIKKLDSTENNKTEITLRISKKNFA